MTNGVDYYSGISASYEVVGNTCPSNPWTIVMLRFPELDTVSTRGNPCPALTMESLAR